MLMTVSQSRDVISALKMRKGPEMPSDIPKNIQPERWNSSPSLPELDIRAACQLLLRTLPHGEFSIPATGLEGVIYL